MARTCWPPALLLLTLLLTQASTSEASEESERTLWKVQHTLGAAQLLEKRGELEPALEKLTEVESILTALKSELTSKIRSKVTAQANEEQFGDVADVDVPVEFSINVTHVPETCPAGKTVLGSVLKIHFVGKTVRNGKVFATSFHTGSNPLRFTLGSKDVVEAWNLGLLGMCVTERRRLLVPPNLGYGATSVKGVSPFSNLRYDIELVEHIPPKDEV